MSLGYAFVSQSDTEVILKAFQAWGVSCVDKFRGMFAFVIYDRQQHKLFMFRDRAGVKPFYYYVKDGLFLFARMLVYSTIPNIFNKPVYSVFIVLMHFFILFVWLKFSNTAFVFMPCKNHLFQLFG